jgi:hypothetical protein
MSGPAWVHYGQIYVQSSDSYADLGDCLGGQANGLCGAAVSGTLFLITGLHTGKVGFAVELHEEAPAVDDAWDEIVEASFRPSAPEVALVGWGGEGRWPLALEQVDYRVRYCGSGLDAAREADTSTDDESFVDHYLLQFWPAPPEPDRVVKQTSACAAYWHEVARKQPRPPSPEERAEQERQAALERDRRDAELRLADERRAWGGSIPGDRLRNIGWPAQELARISRPLVDAIDRADAGTQRAVARWAARRAYTEARLAQLDWIAPILDAMDRGEDLPPEMRAAESFDRMLGDENLVHTAITTLDGSLDNYSQPAMAFPALGAAYADDPLEAAVVAVLTAVNTYGFGRAGEFVADLRRAFPAPR